MNFDACKTPSKIVRNSQTSICAVKIDYNETPKRNACRNNFKSIYSPSSIFNKKTGTFHLFPVANTPPRFPKIINPFDAALNERLHLPLICSPLIRKSTTPTNNSSMQIDGWTIDEVSSLSTINVEPCETQFQETSDPDAEAKAQAAINSFFNEHEVVPSPIQCPINKVKHILTEKMLSDKNDGYRCDYNNVNLNNKQDGIAQTVLTLPPNLPKNVEDVLKEYFTFNENQQQTYTNCDTSVDHDARDASLRQRLFGDPYYCYKNSECWDIKPDFKYFSPQSPKMNLQEILIKKDLETTMDGSVTSQEFSISPIHSESFAAISPISKTPNLASYKRIRYGSDSSIDIYRSTPERLIRSASYIMDKSADSSFEVDKLIIKPRSANCSYNNSFDEMQISLNISTTIHPTTPLRSRFRTNSRKNLSQSFSLAVDKVQDIDKNNETTLTQNVISVELDKSDSGFNDGYYKKQNMKSTTKLDLFNTDVSMNSIKDDDNFISSTPSKVSQLF